ncbi:MULTISPECIES: heme/hemin ABC transporter substrate-binding protein [Tatumella]|uniref:Hemin ABC transporter substrate-binding protein n=1 Tax=Tatumella punctata TaxID=399969 RepID=A0ABW1VQB8_9GAMM|nr:MULTISPECIES: ABC transporter substrate-binding protein [unclassified Tatumella]MBS0856755.1 ABC transporter substrate-binding protein [Tatumella sp. JGM16]MBS0894439.1 ABC transporter substrate-binding protein [Tatumella sp. JGM130]MBS0913289.1 ABC transporter substrate-binding protein [Tatumella sp. JGM91]
MKIAGLILCLLALPVFATRHIVSIGGDVTEIVYALGAGQQLAGRDSTSIRPLQARKLPDVGYMRQLNTEGILALKPSLVLVSEQAKPSQVLEQLSQAGVKVVPVSGENSLPAILQKITTIAAALNENVAAQPLLQQVRQQTEAIPSHPLAIRALYIMANSGMTTLVAGNQTAADVAIRSAGLINVMGSVPHYQPMSAEGIIAAAPDLVLMDAGGVAALGGPSNVWQLPGLAMTPAGQHQRLLYVDQMALLGFGPDTPQAIRRLRQDAEKIDAQ